MKIDDSHFNFFYVVSSYCSIAKLSNRQVFSYKKSSLTGLKLSTNLAIGDKTLIVCFLPDGI